MFEQAKGKDEKKGDRLLFWREQCGVRNCFAYMLAFAEDAM
jgi:hypothetical protein